jgi:hypothetical protein
MNLFPEHKFNISVAKLSALGSSFLAYFPYFEKIKGL